MNNLEERLQAAYSAYKEGCAIRKVCKDNNISKAYFKDYLARMEKLSKTSENKDLSIGNVPTLDAPDIKFDEAPKHEEHVMDLFEVQAEREFKLAVGLAKYRYSKGLTQEQFAATCGVSCSVIGLYESGRVRFDINNRQSKMVYTRIGLSIDEIINFSEMQIVMPKYKGYDIVRRNVSDRLNVEFGVKEELNPEVDEQQADSNSIEIDILNQKNKQLMSIQSGLNKKITNLQEQLDEVSANFNTTIKNLKAAEKKMKELEEELKNRDEKIRELTAKNTSLKIAGNKPIVAFDEEFYKNKILELEAKLQRQERVIDKLCA